MGMTNRQRMMAVYRNQLPDQVPVGIYTRYLPRGAAEREARALGVGVIDYHPVSTMLAPPWHTYPGFLSEVRGAEFEIQFSWRDGELIETRTYRTPVGTLTERLRQDPSYGSDWVEKHYISSPEDYKVMQYLVENTVLRRNEEGFLAKQENLGEDGVVLGRVDRSPFQKLMAELAGPEQFLVDLAITPEPVISLLEAMEARMDEIFEIACESQAEVIWQPENISCDLTSPKYYEKYCLPHYAKHGAQLRAKGKTYVVHMDGRVRAIRDLVARSTIDCIESLSFTEIGGDLPFSEARAAWPGKVILPNFPASLALESEEKIFSFFQAFRKEVGPEKPFMIQVSEDIPAGSYRRVLPTLFKALNS